MDGERASTTQARRLVALLAEGVERLAAAGLDDATLVEGHQWMLEFATGMTEYHLHADPLHPVVMPMVTPFRRFLGDLRLARHCYVARLDGRVTYRLRCRPGDAAFVSVTVHADEAGGVAGDRALGKRNLDEIERGPDGSFALLIGPSVTGPNTIRTDASVGSLMTREFFDTDESERVEARWYIEVVDPAEVAPSRPDDASFAAALAAACTAIEGALGQYPRPIDAPVFGTAPQNEFAELFAFTPDAVTTWGNLDAVHTTLAYDLGEDEALVIDGGVVVPCAWWGLSQNNRFLASFGRGEPTAIPGARLRVDPQGCWRVVLSARRPAADVDWLSTAGHRNGVLRIRWLQAAARPDRPRTRRVKLDDLGG